MEQNENTNLHSKAVGEYRTRFKSYGPTDSETTIEMEVPFAHIDMMKIVWHGHYFTYFEAGRTALLRSRGLDVDVLEELQFCLVVTESHVRHIAPLHYGDVFCCSSWFTQVDCSLKISYSLWLKDSGKRIAKGHTVLAILNHSNELLLRTPDAIRELLPH